MTHEHGEDSTSLFVWRERYEEEGDSLWRTDKGFLTCPCCDQKTVVRASTGGGWAGRCPLCGWYLSSILGYLDIRESVLREFDINAQEVTLNELGAHLKRRYRDVYDLSWRRFEELVADVFKEHGFDTVLTAPTKDGGADVLLFRDSRRCIDAIVECKKYRQDRRVGIGSVRALVGVAVAWETKRAFLVTSSDFSTDSKVAANRYGTLGFEVDLVGASELLQLLGAYNTKLPPLHKVTEFLRRGIVARNSPPGA